MYWLQESEQKSLPLAACAMSYCRGFHQRLAVFLSGAACRSMKIYDLHTYEQSGQVGVDSVAVVSFESLEMHSFLEKEEA